MNLHEHKNEFESAINMTAQTLQIRRHFVEKDYWICRSLQLMMRHNTEHRAVFKGGTSLTKAYGIGYRFSEDIVGRRLYATTSGKGSSLLRSAPSAC